jgi:hypothetical protein
MSRPATTTTERRTVTRVDIEHAIDAREEARVKHVHACLGGHPEQRHAIASFDAYVAARITLLDLLDRWEDQLRGWEEGA